MKKKDAMDGKSKHNKYIDFSDNNRMHKMITEEISFNDKDMALISKRTKKLKDPNKGFLDNNLSSGKLFSSRLMNRRYIFKDGQ